MYAPGSVGRNWYISRSDMYWELGGGGYFHFRNSSDADVASISSGGIVSASQFNGSGAGLSSGTVPVAALASTSTTVNGTVCTLGGSSCTVTAAASGSAGGALAGTYPNPSLASTQTGSQTWSAAQTFSTSTNFPSGIWNSSGNVGINTTSPNSKLHVYGGEVQMGSSGTTCSSTNAGAVRYTSNLLQYCNGTSWYTLTTLTHASGSTQVAVFTTTGSGTWTVPVDWNNSNNTIYAIGGGGAGAGGVAGRQPAVVAAAIRPAQM